MIARALAAALLAAALLAAAPASAQEAGDAPALPAETLSLDEERARTHFQAGVSHYSEGAYDRALSEFESAWELSRRTPLLLNIATVQERLGHHAAAAERLREYLGLEADDPDRTLLERRIGNLERLAAATAPPAAGDGGSDATPPAPPGPSGPDEGLLAAGVAALVVGGLGLGLFGVGGGLALAEDGALRAGCGATASCTEAEVADQVTYALLADVGLGVGGAGIVVGAVLLAVALASSGGGERAAVLLPYVAADGSGLALRGSF